MQEATLLVFTVLMAVAKADIVEPRKGFPRNKTAGLLLDENIIKSDTVESTELVNKPNKVTYDSKENIDESALIGNDITGNGIHQSVLNKNDSAKRTTNFNVRPIAKTSKGISNNDLSYRRQKRSLKECQRLDSMLKDQRKPDKLEISFDGVGTIKIAVFSTSRLPSRAFAALLAAAIKYKAGYDVYTAIDDRTGREFTSDLAAVGAQHGLNDDKFIIHVDADWEEKEGYPAIPNCPKDAPYCGKAGTRLQEIGRMPATNVHLYAVLSKEHVNNTYCSEANYWLFYRNNEAVLEKCGLLNSSLAMKFNLSSKCIPVLVMSDVYPILNLSSNTHHIPFCEVQLSKRIQLKQQIEDENTSFLFIDYNLGYDKTDENRVRNIELPHDLFPQTKTVTLTLADLYLMRRLNTKIGELLNMTIPRPKDLREVLYLHDSLNNMDEAACGWANENFDKFDNWTKISERKLWFLTIICDHANDTKLYNNVIALLSNKSSFLSRKVRDFNFRLLVKFMNCTDPSAISEQIHKIYTRSDYDEFGGLAAPTVGATEAASAVNNMQVVFYDVPPSETKLNSNMGTTTVSGGMQPLVHSILYFLKKQGWKRIGVISEKSHVATSVKDEFKGKILFEEKEIDKLEQTTIDDILLNFKKKDVRVFFINTGPEAASLIVCEAVKYGMSDDIEYAFIAREWAPIHDCAHTVQVFSISYWWRGGNDTLLQDKGGSKEIRSLLKKRWSNEPWPLLAAPLVDAIQLMVFRLQAALRKHPERYDNLHSTGFTSFLTEDNTTIEGVVEKIKLSQTHQHNPLVFVTAWRGTTSNLVAIWRVYSDINEVQEINAVYVPYSNSKRPSDGRIECTTTTSGEEFYPTCHTPYWAGAGVLIGVILIALCWIHRVRKVQNSRRERETLMRLLSRCERTAKLLEPHLVDRSALELYEELGSGHFGRVRFGMLRARNRVPTPVAAKTLRDDAAPAEEAEFLREGSTMSLLSHNHIVKLVGVCADADGPPLLLMEHAFFGDLLKYLRERRHLAEVFERGTRLSRNSTEYNELTEDQIRVLDPEANHVSPLELTRLGREAAGALEYLTSKHILHRDIRAANCLIDASRILKLADFGMARNVELKNQFSKDFPQDQDSEDYKYICRRRGVFPVPWMAPESLDRGEFSHASDVWALGVLILEIATLGARPYGSWKPMQILRYVRSGGRPPLPRDAAYHTCELTEMCWSIQPEDRASAKNINEYLLEHPVAIRAALRPAWPEPDCALDGTDSGFGEREPEHEWSKGVDLRVSTM